MTVNTPNANKVFARRKRRFGYKGLHMYGATASFGAAGDGRGLMWRCHKNITPSSQQRMIAVVCRLGMQTEAVKQGKFFVDIVSGKNVR